MNRVKENLIQLSSVGPVVSQKSFLRVCLHEMLQADWSMRGPIFHLET